MRTLPILLCALLALPAAAAPQFATVSEPYAADVWRKTVGDPDLLTDDDRETQILPGERVIVKEIQGEWARIEAPEQPEFTHHQRWEGYPGWMVLQNLTLNPPEAAPSARVAANILPQAESFMRTPYLWGGLTKEGVDCSGLVHLVYRRHLLTIPRDSHEQWMKARPLKRAELQPSDLIFSAKADKPRKITHVVLYAGDGQLIEAPQTGMVVRKISFKEKYGKALDDVESGDRVGDRVIYFGSFLH